VFNGSNWAFPYLGMLQSNGTSLSMTHRYDHYLPSWQMTEHDGFYVGDFNGDGKSDLYIVNRQNWAITYLGMLRSDGTGLTMEHRYDGSVPGWQMRRNDQFWIGDVNGDKKDDLFVYNSMTGRRSTWGRWSQMGRRSAAAGRLTGSASGTSAPWIASSRATSRAQRAGAI